MFYKALEKCPYICFPGDGEWCTWIPDGPCDKDCGGGKLWKTRKCECPAPMNGGKDCEGRNRKFWPCNDHPCPSK